MEGTTAERLNRNSLGSTDKAGKRSVTTHRRWKENPKSLRCNKVLPQFINQVMLRGAASSIQRNLKKGGFYVYHFR